MSNEPTAQSVVALIREATLRDEGTSGSILFLDANKKLAQDNSNFFWDDTNNRLGIGITAPTGKLHVNQSSSTGAIPALHLEQDDVSEEAIRLTGSAGAGILTQTIVAAGEVTTVTSTAFIRINIQDEGNQVTDGNYYIQVNTLA